LIRHCNFKAGYNGSKSFGSPKIDCRSRLERAG
jgi:hypothetical protein